MQKNVASKEVQIQIIYQYGNQKGTQYRSLWYAVSHNGLKRLNLNTNTLKPSVRFEETNFAANDSIQGQFFNRMSGLTLITEHC